MRVDSNHESRDLLACLSFAVLLFGMTLAFPSRVTAEEPGIKRRPNIIYIMLDDAGYGDFGASGSPHVKTPTFDRLCREGIFFGQHYSGSAVCAPTRCVLMTGLHSGHCKRRDNKATGNQAKTSNGLVFLDKNDLTVARHLQKAGYTTGGIGKWGLGNPGSQGTPDLHGFDFFLGYLDQVHAHNHYTDWLWKNGQRLEIEGNKKGKRNTYVHDIFETETLSFVRREAKNDKPFFLYLPYTLPHGKYVIPETDPNFETYSKNDWPTPVKNYAAMVSRADQTVGKLLDLLIELEIDDDTIIFYTSDNGPNREHAVRLKSGGPFRGIKRQLTEGGLRAAMAVRWPGKIGAGQKSEFIWSMVDVFPTLAELAESTAPDNIDGTSIVPTLLGKSQNPIEHHYFEIHHPFQQAVRVGHWKGIRFGTESPLELYHLPDDPHEDKNVSSENPAVVKKIESIMSKEHVESPFYPTLKQPKPRKSKKKSRKN